MNIRKKDGRYVLAPESEADEALFQEIRRRNLRPREEIKYNGRHSREGESNNILRIRFRNNGFTVELEADYQKDKETFCYLLEIRNCCFLGSGRFIFMGHREIEGFPVIECCTSICKLCGSYTCDRVESEWKICHACAAKCAHKWVRGIIHAKNGPGMGYFCGICGRGDPSKRHEVDNMTAEQHEAAIERETGVLMNPRPEDVVALILENKKTQ